MPVKEETYPVDGTSVRVQSFAAGPAFKLRLRLAALAAPALAQAPQLVKFKEFAKLAKNPASLLDAGAAELFNGEALPRLVAALADKLEPEATFQLVRDLFALTWVDGKNAGTEEGFNVAFTGRDAFLWQVLVHMLRHNDFFGFGVIGRLLGKLSPTTPQPSAPSTPA